MGRIQSRSLANKTQRARLRGCFLLGKFNLSLQPTNSNKADKCAKSRHQKKEKWVRLDRGEKMKHEGIEINLGQHLERTAPVHADEFL